MLASASLTKSTGISLNYPADTGLKTRVLIITPNPVLQLALQRTLDLLGFSVETASGDDTAPNTILDAAAAMRGAGIILLDVRIPAVANGQLLAALQESGVHRLCAIALIADAVPDFSGEWIARLREGVIDDIVPRNADAASWNTHLSTMQRGHALYCELEHLRETATLELEHDRVTGVFNRETMLSILFRETDRVQRLRGALCLILVELDDLDHWSAAYGPEVTDQLLREVAKRIGRILRSYDLLGRVSRNQFLLALPGCSTINAVMLAERLRMDVFGEPFAVTVGPHKVVQIHLTGSFGVTSSRGRSPVVVLREAELTLAQGKFKGPNTIRCHSESPLAAESSTTEARQLFPESELMLH